MKKKKIIKNKKCENVYLWPVVADSQRMVSKPGQRLDATRADQCLHDTAVLHGQRRQGQC